jgi:general secretion pathway protein A
MYHRYFGLTEAPFSIAVDPRYLFMSARHKDALAHLLYGVGVGGGFILLTGEVGTGKTTINRCVLEQLPENTDIALILNPALNAAELLATVCDELSIDYKEGEQSLKVLTDKLHQFLLANHSRGHNTVLLIDEAQHLQRDVLEQIRLLTNLETNNKKLLQIILIGQPELQTLLARRELRQLSQRITARFQLKPLTLEETDAYINHRLQVAGLPIDQRLFPTKVVKAIYNTSGGIPRLINLLCDRMLLGTYGQNKKNVDMAMMKQAAIEVLGEEQMTPPKPSLLRPALAVAVILLVVGVLIVSRTDKLVIEQLSSSAVPIVPPKPAVDVAVKESVSKPIEQTKLPASPQPLFHTKQQAFNALLQFIEVSNEDVQSPCDALIPQGMACEPYQVNTWVELQTFNRPAVLSVVTEGRLQRYVALVGLTEEQAYLVFDDRVEAMPVEVLGKIWTGAFNFIWRPDQYQTPIGQGSSQSQVLWLANQFAALDKQQKLLAKTDYTDALMQRVKIFQRQNGLEEDGVVGLQTVLKLKEQRGNTITLQDYSLPQLQPTNKDVLATKEGGG